MRKRKIPHQHNEPLEPGIRIGDIQFSGATYQVQVFDPQDSEEIWVFLQLNKEGKIADAFCSCDQGEEGCQHIEAAYRSIYGNHEEPLHLRYIASLWYFLCNLYAQWTNFETKELKEEKKGEFIWRSSGKILFSLSARDREGKFVVETILKERHEETEQNSLKFSNLSPEELEAWREGRPSGRLQFELSFWNDLGQFLMLKQEKGTPYEIIFHYSARGLPHWIQCSFKETTVGFAMPEAHLPGLIPCLATVESPLKVHGLEDAAVTSITYDQVQGMMHIHANPDAEKEERKEKIQGIDVGNWIFVPDDGFYAKDRFSFFGETRLTGEAIVWALEEHRNTLRTHIKNFAIYEDFFKLKYSLTFDGDWNLHIIAYVNEPGDLSRPYSRFWGKWAFVQNDGFYRLADVHFPQVETIVLNSDVSSFVLRNRTWFNTQQGFQTHLTGIESRLTYHVDEEGGLRIGAAWEGGEKEHDFGHWIYVHPQGFYQKVKGHAELSLPLGTYIKPDSVPYLIRTLHGELANIPHFFSSKNPVEQFFLDVKINEQGNIFVEAVYKKAPGFSDVPLKMYEEYVYAEGFGFHLLPLPPTFPKKFTRSTEIDEKDADSFLHQELSKLENFIRHLDRRLEFPQFLTLFVESLEKNEGGQYIASLVFHSDLGSVNAGEVWKTLHGGKSYLFSPAGAIFLGQERFKWLTLLRKKQIDLRKKRVRLHAIEFLRINVFDSMQVKETVSEETKALFQELMEFKTPEEPDISELRSTLWNYQENGFRWLWVLYHHHLSGLLCDDMGLGKTHQAMALMAAVRAQLSKQGKPCHILVICPTSVIYHWQDKLRAFLPNVRICTFYGSERSLEGFHHEYDLLLTSYGIWRREAKLLKKTPFEIVILDEIQLAKNVKSKLHASLRDIHARIRLGMTGTPIENELAELKALFDLVLPQYMPGETEFKEYFQKPIEREGNLEKKVLLSRYVRPFILRRKKEDVLTDLPEKIEEISYCPLLAEQRSLYREVLENSRSQIFTQLEDASRGVPYLHIFALLSRLKQICDHPAVFYKDPGGYKKYTSGKWELFLELLHEAKDSGKKIVVFSQYLSQLDIIEGYLQEQNIGYAAIRGETVKRREEIERFRDDPSCWVFVASLQAAGLGIDLTSASVVIHYDRWWNAARENQATDRVHRIGQSRGVQVFKLVTRGTFEEKIHAMIERKRRLMEDVIGVDDQQIVKMLSHQEILELLQDVHVGSEDQQDLITDV